MEGTDAKSRCKEHNKSKRYTQGTYVKNSRKEHKQNSLAKIIRKQHTLRTYVTYIQLYGLLILIHTIQVTIHHCMQVQAKISCKKRIQQNHARNTCKEYMKRKQ